MLHYFIYIYKIVFSSKLSSSAFLRMYSGLILILYPAAVANVSSGKTELYLDQFMYDL